MDFDDTPEEQAFRCEARAWLEKHLQRRRNAMSDGYLLRRPIKADEVAWARRYQAAKAHDGYGAITWPREYGGFGGSVVQQVIWFEEESHFEVPTNIFGVGLGLAGPTIMVHGTQDQKATFLPRILAGEVVFCQLFSEPSAGSDLAAVQTRAQRHGEQWRINGQKVWNSLAHLADYGILLARTDPAASKHKGLSFFILPMRQTGVTVRPIRQITDAANFNEVFLDDVEVPDTNRLGAVGEGWAVALTTLMNERLALGGRTPGPDPEALLDLAASSVLDGQPAILDAAVRQELAEVYAMQSALRFTGWRALTAISKGKPPGPVGSIGKLAAGLLAQRSGALAMGLQGANGALWGETAPGQGLWQQVYLSAAATRIGGGPDEVQRNIIAERLLGLPGELREDKNRPFNQVPTGPGRKSA